MKIKFIDGVCQNCKKIVETTVDANVDRHYDKNDLESFTSYKNTGLSVCPNCGYVAPDITKYSNIFLKEKEKINYDFYYSYGYLPNISKIDTEVFESYAPNHYECYAKCLLSMGDIKNGIRFMYRAIEIKKAIIKILKTQEFEDYDADDIEERRNIEAVINELQQSIIQNQREIVNAYENQGSIFTLVMYAITLKELGETKQLENVIKEIENFNIEQNLLDYLTSKTN